VSAAAARLAEAAQAVAVLEQEEQAARLADVEADVAACSVLEVADGGARPETDECEALQYLRTEMAGSAEQRPAGVSDYGALMMRRARNVLATAPQYCCNTERPPEPELSAAAGPPPDGYKLGVGCRCFVEPRADATELEYSLDRAEVFGLLETHVDASDGTIWCRSADGWIRHRDPVSGMPVLVGLDQVGLIMMP
jgi:hypothetical protein